MKPVLIPSKIFEIHEPSIQNHLFLQHMAVVDAADLAANSSAAHQLCKLNEYMEFYGFIQQYCEMLSVSETVKESEH